MTCWGVSAALAGAVALAGGAVLCVADEAVDVPLGEPPLEVQAAATSVTAGNSEAASKPVNRRPIWIPSSMTSRVVHLAG
jgi:hypothetical protein